MKKKFIVLVSSLLAIVLLFVVNTKTAYAACECLQNAFPLPAGSVIYDNLGVAIPETAFGLWNTTPPSGPGVNPADQEPRCPTNPAPVGGGTCYNSAAGPVPGPLMEGCACNVYTQGFVKTWFRVPTLGDLIGNVIRLIFFIAGLYALVLLLLGGFEWVSSGGEEKKLTSARGKIMNAIIGLVVMVAVLTLVILLEQVVFGGKVCLGISCPINMGDLSLIK